LNNSPGHDFNESKILKKRKKSTRKQTGKVHISVTATRLTSNAGVELKTAERLQPGLPFAKPEALQNLKSRISSVSHEIMPPNISRQNIPAIVKNWMPTVLLILGNGLIVLLIGFMSRLRDISPLVTIKFIIGLTSLFILRYAQTKLLLNVAFHRETLIMRQLVS